MTIRLRERGISLVLLDIEGTTTPITFVYDVLFPYARSHLRSFLTDADDESRVALIAALRSEYETETGGSDLPPSWGDAPPAATLDSAVRYADWLMDRDRKSPALKQLQGRIWEGGYASGALRGDVFDDVPVALQRWTDAGLHAAIYSSGSVLAQRLLFSSTTHGDLTSRLSGFFDTGVGPKRDAESYREIARRSGVSPSAILFVSDVTAELDAARDAGCEVLLAQRPGNPPQPGAQRFTAVSTFDEIGP